LPVLLIPGVALGLLFHLMLLPLRKLPALGLVAPALLLALLFVAAFDFFMGAGELVPQPEQPATEPPLQLPFLALLPRLLSGRQVGARLGVALSHFPFLAGNRPGVPVGQVLPAFLFLRPFFPLDLQIYHFGPVVLFVALLDIPVDIALVRADALALHRRGCREAALQRRALRQAGAALQSDEVLVVDAGFGLADLLTEGVPRFVARVARNFTARCNVLPAYQGRGRRPSYGARVRPLPRTHKGKTIAATPPNATAQWVVAGRIVRAHVWNDLVLATAKPGAATFRCVVIHDPRYLEPLVMATNLPMLAYAVWCLYRDRWPIEQLPLAAKQMLGAHRAFVFGGESRYRLPELGLLAGNVLTYVAATTAAIATGFWDRCCRPTCGRLRRLLLRVDFSEVPVPEGSLRKKASVTAHLPKGVQGHRRRWGRSGIRAKNYRRR
jgi:hypothetical protein